MKKFTIIHNFTAVASIEVIAETREEAFEKAKSAYFTISSDSMILPQTEKGLEHHTYTILTKNCTVAYQLLVK